MKITTNTHRLLKNQKVQERCICDCLNVLYKILVNPPDYHFSQSDVHSRQECHNIFRV